MPGILTFGEILWDVYENESLIGGAGLNFASHCAKCGAKSYMISAIGDDELGRNAIEKVKEFGVEPRFIGTADTPTGQCTVTLNEAKIPTFRLHENSAYDNITLSETDLEEIREMKFDALCFGTLIQRGAVSRNTLKTLCAACAFPNIVCDVNLRKNCYDADSVKFCLENATVLKVSDEEEPELRKLAGYTPKGVSHKDIAEAVCNKFGQIRYILLTLGEKGSYVYSAGKGEGFYCEAEKVTPVSTVGAGDSYTAAWINAYINGKSPEEATKNAALLSGYVVSRADAIPPYSFEGDKLITE